MSRSLALMIRRIWSKSPSSRTKTLPQFNSDHSAGSQPPQTLHSSYPWPSGPTTPLILRGRQPFLNQAGVVAKTREATGFKLLSVSRNAATYSSSERVVNLKEETKAPNAKSLLHFLRDRVIQSPYARLMRLDKPIGTHLLFLPGAWAITMGAASIGDAVSLYALFYSGSVLLRGAGCTINDIWDQDIDAKVQRTRSRPLAANEISVPRAFAFLGTQLSAGLMVLLCLNNTSIVVGAPAVIPAMFYPLAKRITNYPQAVLGLTINWGALLGYTAACDTLSASAFCLYGAGWCWTMIYDTIYAHQDKKDDAQVGVKSSALSLGSQTRPALMALSVAKLGFLSAAGFLGDLSPAYYAGLAFTGAHVVRQVTQTDFDDPSDCEKAFKSNAVTGALTWAALAAGRLI